jgi:hypothetical protein
VRKIYYSVKCDIRRCTALAAVEHRPVDHIGWPQANLDICAAHAAELIQFARAKGLEVQ